VFVAGRSERGRRAWLAGRLTVKGTLHVDAGAAKALNERRSLLPAGVVRVEGLFRRGDVLDIIAPDGHVLARGLAEYDLEDAVRITGKRTDMLTEILGYAPRAAMVHRNHMVLIG